MKIHYYTLLFLLIGLFGFILFFPVPISATDCCLWHYLFHEEQTKMAVLSHVHMNHHHMIRDYIFPYGFIWWMSIAFLYWSIKKLSEKGERKVK